MMDVAVRPLVSCGVALAGAVVIAATPVGPPPTVEVPEVVAPSVQLTATIGDILTLPTLRQYILNRVEDIVTLAVGLSVSANALVDAIVGIPGVLGTAFGQILDNELVEAADTIQAALRDGARNVIGPTFLATVERSQRALAVTSALVIARPTALIQFGDGILRGLDRVSDAFLLSIEGLIDAILPLDLGAIAGALVDGTQLVLGSFGPAIQEVIDGTVAAQQTFAEAYAAEPPPPPEPTPLADTGDVRSVDELVNSVDDDSDARSADDAVEPDPLAAETVDSSTTSPRRESWTRSASDAIATGHSGRETVDETEATSVTKLDPGLTVEGPGATVRPDRTADNVSDAADEQLEPDNAAA